MRTLLRSVRLRLPYFYYCKVVPVLF